nr:hypothetical protein [Microbacterium pseudoresistens]
MKRDLRRRLAYDAARHDLQRAQEEVARARVTVKLARADAAKAAADRAVSAVGAAEVAAARRALRDAELALRAGVAAVRARRAQRDAARQELASALPPEQWPLPRLHRAHDALTARWMTYETDPHKLIAFPTMSDGRDPDTGLFFTAAAEAQRLRPDADDRQVTASAFSAYRDAVDAMGRALDRAERAARARAEGRDPAAERARAASWQEAAHDAIGRSARLLDDAAGAVSSAISQWTERNPFRRGEK